MLYPLYRGYRLLATNLLDVNANGAQTRKALKPFSARRTARRPHANSAAVAPLMSSHVFV